MEFKTRQEELRIGRELLRIPQAVFGDSLVEFHSLRVELCVPLVQLKSSCLKSLSWREPFRPPLNGLRTSRERFGDLRVCFSAAHFVCRARKSLEATSQTIFCWIDPLLARDLFEQKEPRTIIRNLNPARLPLTRAF